MVGEGDGDVAAGVLAVRPRDRAGSGPAGGSGSRGRVVAGVLAAPGPEGGGDRAAAGRLRPGDPGGPAGLRGPVAAGQARPAGAEAGGLQLGDIDWRAGEIAVTGKGSRTERLPLPARPGRHSPPGWSTGGRSASRGRCS